MSYHFKANYWRKGATLICNQLMLEGIKLMDFSYTRMNDILIFFSKFKKQFLGDLNIEKYQSCKMKIK